MAAAHSFSVQPAPRFPCRQPLAPIEYFGAATRTAEARFAARMVPLPAGCNHQTNIEPASQIAALLTRPEVVPVSLEQTGASLGPGLVAQCSKQHVIQLKTALQPDVIRSDLREPQQADTCCIELCTTPVVLASDPRFTLETPLLVPLQEEAASANFMQTFGAAKALVHDLPLEEVLAALDSSPQPFSIDCTEGGISRTTTISNQLSLLDSGISLSTWPKPAWSTPSLEAVMPLKRSHNLQLTEIDSTCLLSVSCGFQPAVEHLPAPVQDMLLGKVHEFLSNNFAAQLDYPSSPAALTSADLQLEEVPGSKTDRELRQSCTQAQLEPPVLCASNHTAMKCAIAPSLQPVVLPAQEPAHLIDINVTFDSIVSKDTLLDDIVSLLPAVIMDSASTALQAESALNTWRHFITECGIRPALFVRAELHLDWSLVRCGGSSPQPVRQALAQLQHGMSPEAMPLDSLNPLPLREKVAALAVKYQRPSFLEDAAPEKLPAVVQRHLQGKRRRPHSLTIPQKVHPMTGLTNNISQPVVPSIAAAAAERQPVPPAEPRSNANGAQAGATGVYARPTHSPPQPAAADRGKADLSFFMQLQQGSAAAAQAAPSPSSSATSADSIRLGDPLVTVVELPQRHQQLMAALVDDHRKVLCSTNGVPLSVTSSSIVAIESLQAALEAAARLEQQNPGSQRALLRGYAALALLRQTALLLMQYGVRCAHLYLRQSLAELPGAAAACGRSAKELGAAYGDVECGRLEDHPKLAALRSSLTAFATVKPGAKVLVVAAPRCFFTMYRTITEAGLRPFQLGRDERFADPAATPGAFVQAIQQAASSCDCLLATHQQLAVPKFPFNCFRFVVEYEALQAGSAVAASAVAEAMTQAGLERHQYDVALLPALQQGEARRAAVPLPKPVQAPVKPTPSRAAMVAQQAPEHVAESCAPPMAQTTGPMPPAAQQQTANGDWPVVVNCRRESLVRCRRDLYEAVLRLERSGSLVLERSMAAADMVLSPSNCLALWTQDVLMKVDDLSMALKEKVGCQLCALSFAFSTCLLVIEGGKAFEVRMVACIEVLLALAHELGMRLQVLNSNSPEQTQDIITAAVVAHRPRSQPNGASMSAPPALSDAQTPQEAFLNSFLSLNPFSAALLLGCGLPFQQLLTLRPDQQQKLGQSLPQIPAHSLELFFKQLAYGEPVTGHPGAPVTLANEQAQAGSLDLDDDFAALLQDDEDPRLHLQKRPRTTDHQLEEGPCDEYGNINYYQPARAYLQPQPDLPSPHHPANTCAAADWQHGHPGWPARYSALQQQPGHAFRTQPLTRNESAQYPVHAARNMCWGQASPAAPPQHGGVGGGYHSMPAPAATQHETLKVESSGGYYRMLQQRQQQAAAAKTQQQRRPPHQPPGLLAGSAPACTAGPASTTHLQGHADPYVPHGGRSQLPYEMHRQQPRRVMYREHLPHNRLQQDLSLQQQHNEAPSMQDGSYMRSQERSDAARLQPWQLPSHQAYGHPSVSIRQHQHLLARQHAYQPAATIGVAPPSMQHMHMPPPVGNEHRSQGNEVRQHYQGQPPQGVDEFGVSVESALLPDSDSQEEPLMAHPRNLAWQGDIRTPLHGHHETVGCTTLRDHPQTFGQAPAMRPTSLDPTHSNGTAAAASDPASLLDKYFQKRSMQRAQSDWAAGSKRTDHARQWAVPYLTPERARTSALTLLQTPTQNIGAMPGPVLPAGVASAQVDAPQYELAAMHTETSLQSDDSDHELLSLSPIPPQRIKRSFVPTDKRARGQLKYQKSTTGAKQSKLVWK